MGDQWTEFKRQPGIFYRISTGGRLELLGSNLGSLRDWSAIAEEIRREWFLSKHQSARPVPPDPDQLDLFPVRGIGGKRLDSIPLLRRDRQSA